MELREVISRLFSGKRKQKTIVLSHRKEKLTKPRNGGKVKKKDKDQRSAKVEQMITEPNKRCMVSKNL